MLPVNEVVLLKQLFEVALSS